MTDIVVQGATSSSSMVSTTNADDTTVKDQPEGEGEGGGEGKKRYSKKNRTNRACDPCSKVKMRCIGGNDPPCTRCSRQGYSCTFVLADSRALGGRKRGGGRSRSTTAGLDDEPGLGRSFTGNPSQSVTAPETVGPLALPPITGSMSEESSNFTTSQPSIFPLPASLTSTWVPSEAPAFSQPLLNQSSNAPTFGDQSFGELSTFLDLQGIPDPQPDTPQSHTTGASSTSAGTRINNRESPSISQLRNPLGLLVLASLDPALPKSEAKSAPGGGGEAEGSVQGEVTQASSESNEDDPLSARSRDIYFRPTGSKVTLKRKMTMPAACAILTKVQIEELFSIFYQNYHIHAPIVDREHGTAEQISGRSHFLFHAICGVAMRGWNGPAETQEKLLKIIFEDMRRFPRERTLECVQALLLVSTWNPVSPQHMDLDMQYLRVGMAVRLAMDLRLHELDTYIPEDVPAWVLRSQRRTWALCYIFDAKLSAHRHRQCYTPDVGLIKLQTDGSADDQRMLSSVEWCRIIGRICNPAPRTNSSRPSPIDSGASTQESELDECASIDASLLHWKDRWVDKFMQMDTPAIQTLLARTRLYYYYAQLLNYANGLQSICHEPDWNNSVYANRYIDAVNRLLYTFVEDFGLYRIAAYLSDLHFTYIAFTAVSLVHSLSIGLSRRSYESSSTLRLLHRVADLFESSAGKYGHNLRNQGHFLRAVVRAKLDDNGEPLKQPAPVMGGDFWGFGTEMLNIEEGDQFMNSNLDDFGLAPSTDGIAATDMSDGQVQQDSWGFAVPVAFGTQTLDGLLSSTNGVLHNNEFDSVYWGAFLQSRQGSPVPM
ncbi:hypothetical protein T439DRAFT_323242 [Meredithblackwellia eburnea MCA 4105]